LAVSALSASPAQTLADLQKDALRLAVDTILSDWRKTAALLNIALACEDAP
jgi:hypothetical protein